MTKKNILLFAVVFQIFLLAMMIFSQSYQIHQLDLIPLVSAEDTFSCCTKTNEGAICQDVTSDYPNCAEELISTKCESTSDCKIGCCVDETEGLCTTTSPRGKCEDDGGVWQGDKNCNVFECQKGCCVLGESVEFVTNKRCEQLSLVYGFESDFRDLETEYECLALAASQSKGACVFDGGVCKFTTESECEKLEGSFSKDALCSKESLNTNCEKQASIGCVEGKDEIYWFDSCGNRENIYSSDKEECWNKGEVLEKEESCGAGSSNANSQDCGNCNYFLGSRCSETNILTNFGITGNPVKEGGFGCEDLNCVDENGKTRTNGESWCVYDGFIGDGKDTVGSRHWKRICIDGEIKVDPCADYRGQICVQSEINGEENNFSIAACVINEATKCLNYNSKKDMVSCQNNEYCVKKDINVDSDFQFDVCVGKYPRGFDLSGASYLESSSLCSMASQTCTVVYVKKLKGWDCVSNCECESERFSNQMSDLCISLGDCGSYVNYIGDGTQNSKVKNAPKVSWQDYKEYAEINKSQFAKPASIGQILATMGSRGGGSGSNIDEEEEGGDDFAQGVKLLGTISGSVGTIADFMVKGKIMSFKVFGGVKMSPATSSTLSSVGAAATGASIGMLVGGAAVKLFDLKGDAATAVTFAGMAAGGVAGYGAATYGVAVTGGGGGIGTGAGALGGWGAGAGGAGGGLGGLSTFGGAILNPMIAAFVWAVIVVVVVVIIMKVLGIGESKEVKVKFSCMPWEAPLGGGNCGKCDDDPLKPCSEYRCESLGQACRLLNEDTENPVCESIPNDNTPPIISNGDIIEGFGFFSGSVKIKTSDGKCIPEFTPVLFSLNTNEYAQCKYSLEKTNNYEEMEELPFEQNAYTKNHTFAFSMPSVDSVKTYNITGNLSEMYSDMNMYVRCQDYHGNYNLNAYIINFCISQGPDVTPPSMQATNPRHNSYLAYGKTNTNLDIYLNEPAECKIDPNDKVYESLRYNMTCNTDLLDYTDFGWKCSTTLTGLDDKENNFYIRCKDQPWLINDTITIVNNVTNETTYKTRNVNTESFVFTLKGSTNKLNITSVSPSGEIRQGFEPITVDLKASTFGGAENGKAACYYKFSENWTNALFLETFSDSHKQTFNTMMSGEYNIWIECEDAAGNIANEQTNFNLDIDSKAPVVVRTYHEDNKLVVLTDEDAECYYDFNRCNFDINDAEEMTTAFSTEHDAEWIIGKVYHIKCADIWGNTNSDCTIKVRTE